MCRVFSVLLRAGGHPPFHYRAGELLWCVELPPSYWGWEAPLFTIDLVNYSGVWSSLYPTEGGRTPSTLSRWWTAPVCGAPSILLEGGRPPSTLSSWWTTPVCRAPSVLLRAGGPPLHYRAGELLRYVGLPPAYWGREAPLYTIELINQPVLNILAANLIWYNLQKIVYKHAISAG